MHIHKAFSILSLFNVIYRNISNVQCNVQCNVHQWLKVILEEKIISYKSAGGCSNQFLATDYQRDGRDLKFELLHPGKKPLNSDKKRLSCDVMPSQNISYAKCEREVSSCSVFIPLPPLRILANIYQNGGAGSNLNLT